MFIRGDLRLDVWTVTPDFSVAIFSPAKLNLFLAVTGRRADGYHDLVSLAVTLDFGDTLWIEPPPAGAEPAEVFTLECDDPAAPRDGSNLVLQAARAFAAATGWRGGAHFRLGKRIPLGAGLGGGSSNGTAALRGLARFSGRRVDGQTLAALAGALGSDCALFLAGGPVIMRGRGERLEPLPAVAAARLRGRRVLLFKPDFGIGTAWAYQRMAGRAPSACLPAEEAERKLAAWLAEARAPAADLLFNNLETVAFHKYLALPALLGELRGEFGLAAGMSGSGSACFALLDAETPVGAVTARIREAWGAEAWVQAAEIL